MEKREQLEQERWPEIRAKNYIDKYDPIKAVNYVPSYCYNYIQLWYDFQEEIIQRELQWAESIGLNSLRMFIPTFSYQKDGQWELVKKNAARFIDMADECGMSVMWTFQPNYIRNEKQELEQQPFVDFKAGRHINHWSYPNTDQVVLSEYPQAMDDVFNMLHDFINDYRDDTRIIAWDLWNETSHQDRGVLEEVFDCVRKINPSQPLTACWEAFDLSDIITFHNYTQPGKKEQNYPHYGSLDFQSGLKRALSFHRPVLCTECLARTEGNTFEAFLPYFAQYHIGFYFWGLCAGSAQYHFPWGWPEGSPEPKDWFHCILYPNGTAYREEELRLLKEFSFQ